MSFFGRTRDAYRQRRVPGGGVGNLIGSASAAPFAAAGNSARDRYMREYNQRRDPNRGILNAAGAAAAASYHAPKNFIIEKQHNFAKDYAAIFFIIIAFFINFILEVRWPQWGFYGIDLEFFKGTILSGDWIGIYNIFHFNIYFLVLVFVVINLRDGKSHSLKVWLTFILITYLLSSIPVLNSYMGIRNVIELFMLLLTAFYLSLSKNISGEDLVATITLLWVFYNLIAFGVPYTVGGFIHFIFIILFYLTFCMGKAFEEDKTQIKWWLLIIIIFDFIIPEFFESIYPNLPISTLPFLLFGTLLFVQAYQPSIWSFIGIVALVSFYFLQFAAAGGAFAQFIDQRDIDSEDTDARKNFWSLGYWGDKFESMMNRSMYYGGGQDQYTSAVDENAKKKLGVYIEDFDENPTNFYDNEEIVLDALLLAENFAEEDSLDFKPIDISLSCSAFVDGKRYAAGEILPRREFQIQSYETENIQCRFQPWQLGTGQYKIRLDAKFNFRTESYLKKYFVAKERIDSLKRQDLIRRTEDILKVNDISDRDPIAQNSVGPVQIKASTNIPTVIELDDKYTTEELFGVQIANSWNGNIKKIDNVQFFFPAPIKAKSCSPFAMQENSLPQDELYEDYSLYEMLNPQVRTIDDNIEQKCWITIEPDERDTILKPGDVTTRYFRMIAEYEYVLEEEISIRTVEREGLKVKIRTADGQSVITSSDSVSCIAEDESLKAKDVEFILYKKTEEGYVEIEKKTQNCLADECFFISSQNFEKGTRLRCDATVQRTEGEENYKETVQGYMTIQNSPPIIKEVSLDPDPVDEGEKVTCNVKVYDPDQDDVVVRFDFTGLNLAPTQKQCSDGCSVDIPVGDIEQDTILKCSATPFDEETGSPRSDNTKVINVE